ncbi:PepSY domain-containing protein [Aquimarina sp. D1M17]|uniref:PepSY domain-containing protein n=1 Tax=Aquimarina acroporae TaxID=2937283 RepID=UPI0020BE8EEE|nr:PepSY domain-containing protein [Aquimarina acroporae]MCK8522842.1 PepSY domain-containing protein [Aquimarina acroporae]
MKKRILLRITRKWHRYLGFFLGIQFLMWTLGGLYFSWTNIDNIRGDNLKNSTPKIPSNLSFVTPNVFLKNHISNNDSILSLELSTILKQPIYRVEYEHKDQKNVLLFDAITGEIRNPLSKEEAILVAQKKLNVTASIINKEYITTVGNHHEYRGRPLPAYAITFDAPANTTVYVSTEYGNVQTFRNNQWRIFDFFWMLHTMDYQERDNFNNILLRAFSLFGLFTIFSGFLLYGLTSKTLNKRRKKRSTVLNK